MRSGKVNAERSRKRQDKRRARLARAARGRINGPGRAGLGMTFSEGSLRDEGSLREKESPATVSRARVKGKYG